MNAEELVRQLEQMGATLERDGDKLRVSVPRGVLSEIVRELLAAHKAELIAVLAGRQPGEPGHPQTSCSAPAKRDRCLTTGKSRPGDGDSQSAMLRISEQEWESILREGAITWLNLSGARLIEGIPNLPLVVGVWRDADGALTRDALQRLGLDQLPVVHLEDPRVPERYRTRGKPTKLRDEGQESG